MSKSGTNGVVINHAPTGNRADEVARIFDGNIVSYQHKCRYYILRRSLRHTQKGERWLERCHCGKVVMVDCILDDMQAKSPEMRRAWFNKNGDLVKVTGGGEGQDDKPLSLLTQKLIETKIAEYQ